MKKQDSSSIFDTGAENSGRRSALGRTSSKLF